MSRLAAELPKEVANGTNGTMTQDEPHFEIPKTYKAAIYDAPGTISTKIVELETPVPGSGQVLIHLTHSGVCK
jgi:alcohol dehydrogenase, propanol-preferring